MLILSFKLMAAVLNGAGWIYYIKDLNKNKVKPNLVGWGLSFIVVMACAYSFFSTTHSISSSAMYLVGVLACGYVVVSSVKNPIALNTGDKITALFCISLIPFLFVYPSASPLILATYYLATYSVFLRSILSGKSSEKITPWLFWVGAALCLILSVLNSSPINIVLPVTNLICWGSVTIAIYWKSRIRQIAEIKV